MVLWNSVKSSNLMMETDWIPESMHAQPLLSAKMIVAMTALIEGRAGNHFSHALVVLSC